MHGLGDSAEGFLDVFTDKGVIPVSDDTKVVLLTAPSRPVTINSGMVMPSWYDMKVLSADLSTNLPIEQRISVTEMKDSYNRITAVVNAEKQGLNGKLFIGGFSQGCVMALSVGLEHENIKGIFGFSGYMSALTKLKNLGKIPIYLFHGKDDDMIPVDFAKKSYGALLKDEKVKFYMEGMLGHGLNLNQLKMFKKVFHETLKN